MPDNWYDAIAKLVYETHARVEWLEKVNKIQADMLIALCKRFELFEEDSISGKEESK